MAIGAMGMWFALSHRTICKQQNETTQLQNLLRGIENGWYKAYLYPNNKLELVGTDANGDPESYVYVVPDFVYNGLIEAGVQVIDTTNETPSV